MSAYFIVPLSTLTKKWRIFHEESADLNPRDERTDFEELRGYNDTRIYRHGQETLAVSTDSGHLQASLRRFPGLTPKNGSVFLFPDSLLDTVAEKIRARRKVQFTEERKAAAVARLARWQFKRKFAAQEKNSEPCIER